MHDLAKEHPEETRGNEKALPRAGRGKQSLPHRGWHLAAHPSRRPDQVALHELDLRRHHHPHARVHRARLGNHNNTVTIDLECGADASGVLYAMGGAGGGLTCYMDKGHLIFEYNLMIIDRSIAKSAEKIAPGKHTIVVNTTLKAPKPGAPADIVLSVDGKEVARTTAKMTVPAAFTASESFDVGTDLGSTVSRDYFERRPFKFDGKIKKVTVELK